MYRWNGAAELNRVHAMMHSRQFGQNLQMAAATLKQDFFKRWRTLAAIEERLQAISDLYKDVASDKLNEVRLMNLSHFSVQGRPIRALRIEGKGWTPGKPRIVITANMHGREWITGMTGVYLAENIAKKAAADPKFLDQTQITVVPVVNPDGFEHTRTTDRLWRKNMKPGRTCKGVDLNRNFDPSWGGPESTSTYVCSDVYVGTEAESEPEAKAIADLIAEAPITVGIDLHSYGGMIIGSWAHKAERHARDTEFAEVGQLMSNAMGNNTAGLAYAYGAGDCQGLVYYAHGTLMDKYTASGGLGFVVEIRGTNFLPAPDKIVPRANEVWKAMQGVVDWARPKEQPKPEGAKPWRSTSTEKIQPRVLRLSGRQVLTH